MNYTLSFENKTFQLFRNVVLAGIMVAITATLGMAGDKADTGTTIKSITPMTETLDLKEIDDPYDYFDVVGFLNHVDGKRVIIGDRDLVLTNGASASGMNLSNIVGAKLNNAGEVVLLMLISNEPN